MLDCHLPVPVAQSLDLLLQALKILNFSRAKYS